MFFIENNLVIQFHDISIVFHGVCGREGEPAIVQQVALCVSVRHWILLKELQNRGIYACAQRTGSVARAVRVHEGKLGRGELGQQIVPHPRISDDGKIGVAHEAVGVGGRITGVLNNSLPQLGARHYTRGLRGLVGALTLIGGKVEQTVFLDRAADGNAKSVARQMARPVGQPGA